MLPSSTRCPASSGGWSLPSGYRSSSSTMLAVAARTSGKVSWTVASALSSTLAWLSVVSHSPSPVVVSTALASALNWAGPFGAETLVTSKVAEKLPTPSWPSPSLESTDSTTVVSLALWIDTPGGRLPTTSPIVKPSGEVLVTRSEAHTAQLQSHRR